MKWLCIITSLVFVSGYSDGKGVTSVTVVETASRADCLKVGQAAIEAGTVKSRYANRKTGYYTRARCVQVAK